MLEVSPVAARWGARVVGAVLLAIVFAMSASVQGQTCNVDFSLFVDVSGSMYVNHEPYSAYNRILDEGREQSLLDYMVHALDRIGAQNPPVLSPTTSVSMYTVYSSLRPHPFNWTQSRGTLFQSLDLDRNGTLNGADFVAHRGESKTDLARVLDEISTSASSAHSRSQVFLVFTDGDHDAASDLNVSIRRLRDVLQARRAPVMLVFFGFGTLTQAGHIADQLGVPYLDFADSDAVTHLEGILRGIFNGTANIESATASWDDANQRMITLATLFNPSCNPLSLERAQLLAGTAGEQALESFPTLGLPRVPPFGKLQYSFAWQPRNRLPNHQFAGRIALKVGGTELQHGVQAAVTYHPEVRILDWSAAPGVIATVDGNKRAMLIPLRLDVIAEVRTPRRVTIPFAMAVRKRGTEEAWTRQMAIDVDFAPAVNPDLTLGEDVFATAPSGFIESARLYDVTLRMKSPSDDRVALAPPALTARRLGPLATKDLLHVEIARLRLFQHLFFRRVRYIGLVKGHFLSAPREVVLRVVDRGEPVLEKTIQMKDGSAARLDLSRTLAGKKFDSPELRAEVVGSDDASLQVDMTGPRQETFRGKTVTKAWIFDAIILAGVAGLVGLLALYFRQRIAI